MQLNMPWQPDIHGKPEEKGEIVGGRESGECRWDWEKRQKVGKEVFGLGKN